MRSRPRPTLATLARALPALLAWAAGCEALVDGKLGDVIHCTQEGMVGPPACPVGSVCRDQLCSPTELGTTCLSDTDCRAGDFCLEPAAYGATGARHCSRTCCTSTDCDPDALFVCWSAPHGAGSFCREAADVGRAAGGGALHALAACTGDADCRSGVCAEGRCADTCCSDTSCADEGGTCRFGIPAVPSGTLGFWCAPPPVHTKDRYSPCTTDAECASGLCIPIAPSNELRCSVPCCASAECELSPEKNTPVACAPVLVGTTWVRACSLLVSGLATGEVGSACDDDGDCRSGLCDGSDGITGGLAGGLDGGHGRCSDACCSDASCGDPSTFACLPVGKRSSWALRCEPK